jgi:thiamine-monophosphate kinase
MNDINKILENVEIGHWANYFSRNPKQCNKLHETDAELIEIPGDSNSYLAITIDTVAEEITTGLYREPYTMGWVTIMACLSDLAAVGATPLGIVISVSYEPGRDHHFISEIARGMDDACQELGVFILGGDTNTTETISLTACSFGLTERDTLMTRRGCMPGDEVFIIGGAGSGNALGLVRLSQLSDDLYPEHLYRPRVNIKAGRLLRNYASCCMDTSDGVLTTLDQLMRLNEVGFDIDCRWNEILLPEVMELCNKTGTPPWMMLAGLHGEFLLLCTIPARNVEKIHSDLRSEGIDLIRMGRVKQSPGITLNLPSGEKADIDMAPIRNLLQTVNGDLNRYIREFWNLGHKWGLNNPGKRD